MIRALVLPADRDKLSGSVLVCGAGRGDGAETGRIATELATGFARAGASTALVRADFTAPEADLDAPGLTAVVAGRVALSDALTVTDDAPGLSVIAAGTAPDSTVDLLSGREFGRIVEELERTVDVVVLHCAPLGDDPGAALVSRTADATLLVVSDRTRRDELSRVEQTLHATGGRVEGIAYVGEPGA
nr:CpsD/CapB family tyrosine-protein kinase [Pseudonocardia sp. AL041005-10]